LSFGHELRLTIILNIGLKLCVILDLGLSFGHELTLTITFSTGLKLRVIFGLGLILELWS